MNDDRKTKKQLINELSKLRTSCAELEQLESAHDIAEQALRESERNTRGSSRIPFTESPSFVERRLVS